ncbi:hypothetical protein CDAR_71361 [Caerostris darwini]|uniref:Uncharacterized protein n=1 Tax=Caerostris darwini TaxID=1538125 RepID=A0AAV4WGU7_9ARAC|nr:hypothetical protein CDAR_71361 [Caerostris darwini]
MFHNWKGGPFVKLLCEFRYLKEEKGNFPASPVWDQRVAHAGARWWVSLRRREIDSGKPFSRTPIPIDHVLQFRPLRRGPRFRRRKHSHKVSPSHKSHRSFCIPELSHQILEPFKLPLPPFNRNQ